MTYTHLTTEELVMITAYFQQYVSVSTITTYVDRSRQRIHTFITFFRKGHTVYLITLNSRKKIRNVVVQPISLPNHQQEYIQKMIVQDWTPDVIICHAKRDISCSVCILYRQYKKDVFDQTTLTMQGKCKTNGHKEKLGR